MAVVGWSTRKLLAKSGRLLSRPFAQVNREDAAENGLVRPQKVSIGEPLSVDVRAIGAATIHDIVRAVVQDNPRVIARDSSMGKNDIVLRAASDRNFRLVEVTREQRLALPMDRHVDHVTP